MRLHDMERLDLTDFSRAPAFVPTSTSASKEPELNPDFDIPPVTQPAAPEAGSESGSDMETASDSDSDSDAPRARSPIVRGEEEDEPAPARGMGMSGFKSAAAAFAGTGPGSGTDSTPGTPAEEQHVGLGAKPKPKVGKAGIGSSARANATPSTFTAASAVPSAFGRAPSTTPVPSSSSNQFIRQKSTPAVVAPASDLRPEDISHFKKIGSSFGAKMLEKMGWQAGKGLGADESGRAVPIQVGKLMRGQGISAGVRTEDSKREARKRGEKFSDDEEDKGPKRGRRKQQQQPAQEQSWKQQRKVKVKVEHKTYEQLLAEAGEGAAPGVGLVLDARGGEVR